MKIIWLYLKSKFTRGNAARQIVNLFFLYLLSLFIGVKLIITSNNCFLFQNVILNQEKSLTSIVTWSLNIEVEQKFINKLF